MNICQELKLKNSPVAVVITDSVPEEAVEFVPSEMGGVCTLYGLKAAFEGKAVYFSGESHGCPGMKGGLGFAAHVDMPGGIEYFLSCGRGQGYPPGERLKLTPEIAKAFRESLPNELIEAKYLLFRPLEQLKKDEKPKLVIFLANPDQLSGLITLFQFEKGTYDDVTAPMVAGCSSVVQLPLNESGKENPKAMVGIVDVWARPIFGADIFAFTIPYEDYVKMEVNSKDCFLQAKTWAGMKSRLV